MAKRNIYKDIVVAGAIAACILFLSGKAKAWQQGQGLCKMAVQAGNDLTGEVVAEFEKLPGIASFLPVDTAMVKVKMGDYTLETEVMGVGIGEYPLEWEAAEPKMRLGNQAMLFVGEGCFASFLDSNGYAPTKGQIEKWLQDYSQLEVTLTDENDHSREARICGILKEPAVRVCMEKGQMQEIFGEASRTRGGYMEIQGAQNAKKTRELLEGAGFQVEEEDVSQ